MNKIELDEAINGLSNVCFSGGAAGADRLFSIYAKDNGFEVINFSFKGHQSSVDENTILEIPSNILCDSSILKQLNIACYSLRRKVPKPGSYVYNLLARNSYQILNTKRVYCIANITSPTQVSGGTAWAVQMYIDSVDNPEIYCYDMNTRSVFYYDTVLKEFTETFSIPAPHGNWTGIGSRNATQKHMEHFITFFKDVK